MCFHYALSVTAQNVANRYGASVKNIAQFEPIYHANGFNFQEMPIIIEDWNAYIASWGLVPDWAKFESFTDKSRQNTLNARAETIFEKPSFKNLISTKRCIIPATSFFEWQHRGTKKYPYSISLTNDEVFSFGGIFNHILTADGKLITSFSIITTEANELMAEIHNSKKRMPLIIHRDNEEKWLSNADSITCKDLLTPFPASLMKAHTVNPKLINDHSMLYSPKIIDYYPFAELQNGLF